MAAGLPGCLNCEDLAHPRQGQAVSLREAAVEKEASAMFSLLQKNSSGASFVGSITGGSWLCTRVVLRFHFQTVVEFLVLPAV